MHLRKFGNHKRYKQSARMSFGRVSVWAVCLLMGACGFLRDRESSEDDVNPPDESSLEKGKIRASLTAAGRERDYIVYVPESYTGQEAFPLLFAFHGYSGNMESSYENSKFYEIAERENFILVHPSGVSSQWNAVSLSLNIDLAFVRELLSELKQRYRIQENRIYSSGMSNGAYFSFLLACEMSDTFAAIGAVSGLMFENVLDRCAPSRPLGVLQIHGTEDALVSYENVEDVLGFWIDHNQTQTEPVVTEVANIDPNDGSTVQRFVYAGGQQGVEVHHLKIEHGLHDWPGHEGNMDIHASQEIWDFVKQYTLEGKVE